MTDDELFELNARVREKMHSAASAVLGAFLRSLHQNTDTRVQLIDPPASSHAAHYTLLSGTTDYVIAYGDVIGLKTVTEDLLEVAS